MAIFDAKDVKHEEVSIAGGSVKVSKVPRPQRKGQVHNISSSLAKLADGMKLTQSYLSSPSEIVTREYPENRETLEFPDRYRAKMIMPHNEDGHHLCTVCGICERICPNASIDIQTQKGEISKKKELDRFIWRMDTCTFCNLCVVTCPFDALEMTPEFENAVYDRRLLIVTLNEYAGPHAKLMNKFTEEEQAQMMEPRDPFGGPTPLGGEYLPRMKPLGKDYPDAADTILSKWELEQKAEANKEAEAEAPEMEEESS